MYNYDRISKRSVFQSKQDFKVDWILNQSDTSQVQINKIIGRIEYIRTLRSKEVGGDGGYT